jgi:hypothetical protein
MGQAAVLLVVSTARAARAAALAAATKAAAVALVAAALARAVLQVARDQRPAAATTQPGLVARRWVPGLVLPVRSAAVVLLGRTHPVWVAVPAVLVRTTPSPQAARLAPVAAGVARTPTPVGTLVAVAYTAAAAVPVGRHPSPAARVVRASLSSLGLGRKEALMWVLGGDCGKIIRDGEPFFGLDGTHYSPQWDKESVPGMQRVVLTPEPTDPGFVVTGNTIEMIDGTPTRVWQQEALPVPTPADLAEQAAQAEANRSRNIAALEAELATLRGAP